MAPNKSEENQAKDGSVKVHIGPEVVCDDVEKVKNEIKLNCCKCSSKKVNKGCGITSSRKSKLVK